MQKQPNKEIVAGSLVCPQCYSILLTLKVNEEGIYTFQKVSALEVSRPLPQEAEEVKVSTETNQPKTKARRRCTSMLRYPHRNTGGTSSQG